MSVYTPVNNITASGGSQMQRVSRVGRIWLSAGIVFPICLLSQLIPAGGSDAAQSSKLPAGSQYVAIGSSYGAGFFIRPQAPGDCGRSEIDYPQLVAAKLHLRLVDVTCGGATTANALMTA
jgi:hypothetical protein